MTKNQKQTTNLSKKYVKDVKTLFPIVRKKEKNYLRQMKCNIDDYSENTEVSSMEALYEEFGKPQEVVYNYFSVLDSKELFSFIRLRRIIKYFLTAVGLILFTGMLFYCITLYQAHIVFLEAKPVYIETEITDPINPMEVYP